MKQRYLFFISIILLILQTLYANEVQYILRETTATKNAAVLEILPQQKRNISLSLYQTGLKSITPSETGSPLFTSNPEYPKAFNSLSHNINALKLFMPKINYDPANLIYLDTIKGAAASKKAPMIIRINPEQPVIVFAENHKARPKRKTFCATTFIPAANTHYFIEYKERKIGNGFLMLGKQQSCILSVYRYQKNSAARFPVIQNHYPLQHDQQ